MDPLTLVLGVLSIVGSSSVVSAFLPAKYRAFAPLIGKVLDYLAFNINNARNATPEQIEDQKAKRARVRRTRFRK